MKILDVLASRFRTTWFALHGVRFSGPCRLRRGVSLERGVRDRETGTIAIGGDCELHHGVCLHAWGGRIALARRVFVGPYAVIYGHGGVEVAENTLVSMHCRILSSNHALPRVGIDIRTQPDVLLPTRIGRDVWLGAGVTVLGGVTIADGCVVGAGAVVASDLPAGAIAVGVPARVIRTRSDQR